MSWPLVTYVLTAALRDKLLLSLLILLVLGASMSVFIGSSAVIEQDRFSVVFAGGGLRVASVLGLVLFVVFFVRRSFENKDVEFLLSRPIGRIQFLLSLATAFSLLGILMGAAVGATLYALSPHLFAQGHILWVVSLMVENMIMVNAALFFSMFLSSASTAAMVTFTFYILSRMMGQILGIIDAGGRLFDFGPMSIAIQMISAVTPRLDLMAQTSWLVYGAGDEIGFIYIIIQGLVFSTLIILASLLDLVFRKF
ncbi:MAG: hypothetical protein DHS20C02_02930 [Micavibrio sp.]|nr:MAG: hypothetical protein DHS20C02_02930 [Micavibrio sp.]